MIGSWSNKVSIRTELVIAAPSVPRNIQAQSVTENSIIISWDAPSDNGGSAITDYRVRIAPENDSNNWNTIDWFQPTNNNE